MPIADSLFAEKLRVANPPHRNNDEEQHYERTLKYW